MIKVKNIQVVCNVPEDMGTDELQIDIIADNRRVFRRTHDMRKGTKVQLRHVVTFNNRAVLKLVEKDGGAFDKDDFLGQMTFRKSNGRHTARIRHDGADYTIKYETAVTNGQTPQSFMPKHIIVELLDVQVDDTEDTAGEDEFYIVGGTVVSGKTAALLTSPIDINDGQRKAFPTTERVLFDGSVKADDLLSIGLIAYDSDAATDWKANEKDIKDAANKVGDVLKKIPDATAQTASLIIKAIPSVVGTVVKMDKDDELGRLALEIPVKNLRKGRMTRTWTVSGNLGGGVFDFSDWHYTVRLRITAR